MQLIYEHLGLVNRESINLDLGDKDYNVREHQTISKMYNAPVSRQKFLLEEVGSETTVAKLDLGILPGKMRVRILTVAVLFVHCLKYGFSIFFSNPGNHVFLLIL